MCRNFLWCGKPAPVSWKKVCYPKQEEGLGLHDLKVQNDAFISKILWDIHSKRDSLWIKWVCGVYLKSIDFWDWSPKPRDSPLLKAVFRVKCALVERTGSEHLARMFLLTAYKKKKFLIALVYDLLRHRGDRAVCWRFTWKPCIPRKFSFILWLALRNRLVTKDRIFMLDSEAACSLCIGHNETANHLFFRCNFSLQVWNRIRDIFGFPKKTIAIRSSIKWIRRLCNGSRTHDKAIVISPLPDHIQCFVVFSPLALVRLRGTLILMFFSLLSLFAGFRGIPRVLVSLALLYCRRATDRHFAGFRGRGAAIESGTLTIEPTEDSSTCGPAELPEEGPLPAGREPESSGG
nr:putative ribonuclease H protein [Ipomoea batatas]